MQLYSRRGVKEYWIADYRPKRVQTYRPQDDRLELAATLVGDEVLTSPLMPGFACPVSRFWASGSEPS